jgi:hypothetical protein
MAQKLDASTGVHHPRTDQQRVAMGHLVVNDAAAGGRELPAPPLAQTDDSRFRNDGGNERSDAAARRDLQRPGAGSKRAYGRQNDGAGNLFRSTDHEHRAAAHFPQGGVELR